MERDAREGKKQSREYCSLTTLAPPNLAPPHTSTSHPNSPNSFNAGLSGKGMNSGPGQMWSLNPSLLSYSLGKLTFSETQIVVNWKWCYPPPEVIVRIVVDFISVLQHSDWFGVHTVCHWDSFFFPCFTERADSRGLQTHAEAYYYWMFASQISLLATVCKGSEMIVSGKWRQLRKGLLF